MKLSRFNLWVEDYPEKGEYLLFNTRTQGLLKINSEFKDVLDTLETIKSQSLSLITQGWLEVLSQNGMVVDSLEAEDAKLKDFFRQLKYEPGFLNFEATVLTTYACNFRCVYCFEESVKNDIFMDQETSDAIIKWLIRIAEEKKYKRIFLVYYGGEPLLNVRPIYDISWHLTEWAQKKGCEFGFGIITNGSMVSADLIDKFLTVGLKNIRVTVDGDRAGHDKKRPFANGQPTFDLIINNIKSVIDKVNVGIVGNFDRENYAGITALLDYLEEEGLLYKLDKIDFTPLAPRLGPKDNPGSIELGECLSYIGKDGLFKEVLAIKRELLRRKLKVSTGLAVNACSLIMQDASITIDPQGAIYKCNALLGYPEFSVGSVNDSALNSRGDAFFNIDAWNKCPQDCPYLPMCQGGCRFFSYLEHKDFSSLACKKEYFDSITPELIKLEYAKLKA